MAKKKASRKASKKVSRKVSKKRAPRKASKRKAPRKLGTLSEETARLRRVFTSAAGRKSLAPDALEQSHSQYDVKVQHILTLTETDARDEMAIAVICVRRAGKEAAVLSKRRRKISLEDFTEACERVRRAQAAEGVAGPLC